MNVSIHQFDAMAFASKATKNTGKIKLADGSERTLRVDGDAGAALTTESLKALAAKNGLKVSATKINVDGILWSRQRETFGSQAVDLLTMAFSIQKERIEEFEKEVDKALNEVEPKKMKKQVS